MSFRLSVLMPVVCLTLVPSIAFSQDCADIVGGSRRTENRERMDDGARSWFGFDMVGGPGDSGGCTSEPRSLFGDSGCEWQFGGWLSAGFTSNAHGNRTGKGNAPFPFNEVADAPVMNQLWFFAEKPLDTEANEIDWGLRVDYFFGTDGPDSQAFGDRGWDYDWNTSRDYGSAIPQLYAEFGTQDAAVKVGYFFGLKGYEATQATDNFFYSHNYAFGYGVPGTHTGVLARYQVTDQLEIEAGWVTGWDSWWSNYLSASTFLGGFNWTIAEGTGLTYHLTAGDFGDGTAKGGAKSNKGNIYAHAIIFERQLSSRLQYALEQVFGSNTNLGTGNNQWYSLSQYLTYEFDECWSAGGRIEWFRDEDGKRVDVNGVGAGSFYDATIGLNWKPNQNIRLRPEIRWDWFNGMGKPFDSRNGGKSGTATQQFTAGLDVVLMF